MEDFFNNVDIPKLSEYQAKLCEEAVVRRCSVKKVFLEILQILQENTCARASFLIKKETLAQVLSCKFCEISKNTFSYRTPLVDASACEEDLTEKN